MEGSVQTKRRLFLFRSLTIFIVLIAIEAIGYIGMCINSRSFDWVSNKNYFRIRAMLIGDRDSDVVPRYMSLPYLGYIPYPNYTKDGVVQHNRDGYRGDRVPLIKTSKLRILCLGGSTTYGYGVALPSQTYPAQLDSLLNERINSDSSLSKKYSGAEVINAGLEAGTSAEELQQYLFKYRYYKPDIIIVHSGVNDAEIMEKASPDFQLDYTHYRRFQFHLEALPVPARWLMRSYFISYLTIRLFYPNFYYSGTSGRACYTIQQSQSFCKWSDIHIDSIARYKDYSFLPFYRNTRSLFEEILRDSSILIVLPNIVNPNDTFVKSNPRYEAQCNENVAISQILVNDVGGVNVVFASDSIKDASYWLDDCHLTADGERNKAQIVLPYILRVASQNTKAN